METGRVVIGAILLIVAAWFFITVNDIVGVGILELMGLALLYDGLR